MFLYKNLSFIILLTFFIYNSYSLKNCLLKCKFDCTNKCTSFRIINQNRIGYAKTNKGFALTQLMKDSLSKKTLKPGFILLQKKEYLYKIFHRNIIKDVDDELWINILLPDSFNVLCTINLNIYAHYKRYNVMKCIVNNFIHIKCEIPVGFIKNYA